MLIERVEEQLQNKLEQADVKVFRDQVDRIPSLEVFLEADAKTCEKLQENQR
jgi:hypothetical protein